MSLDVDDIVDQLGGGLQVAADSLGEHPRFSQYKNAGKALDGQAERRREALERQSKARQRIYDSIRGILEGEEEKGRSARENRQVPRKRKYADVLMTSEWLVDIPEEGREDTWVALLVPVGKRCLLVTEQGRTNLYNKAGVFQKSFSSLLPGGGTRGGDCILDVIWDSNRLRLYCLDILRWNGVELFDSNFQLRRFFLTSRLEENNKLTEISARNQVAVHALPSELADKNGLGTLVNSTIDFEVDGILFYHPEVLYTSGQSPLVGWLKPWMLPELLQVPVPQCLMTGAPACAMKFIEDFNRKHKHVSKVKNEGIIAEEMQE